MKKSETKILTYILPLFSMFVSCEKAELLSVTDYACDSTVPMDLESHPKAAIYQEILDKNQKLEIVGASLMIKDDDGIWLGTAGKADVASNVPVLSCHSFLIASVTKTFTATTVFKYIDMGILSLNDPLSQWLPSTIANNLENVKESTISEALNHTSGIPDYYTIDFELDRINREYNDWNPYDMIKYAYPKSATNAVGETYYYSNSNYLLLGIILERASGKSLSEVFEEVIFEPTDLPSAYYSNDNIIKDDTVKGYVDLYGNGQYVESTFLYRDELGTADGGIGINAYDLGIFYENLLKGNIISEASLNQMTDWFDLPNDWVDEDFGHFQNGMGLEHNKTPYENSVGHTGGIDGFLSIAQYFPESDKTFILLVNSGSYENLARLNIYNETLRVLFNQ